MKLLGLSCFKILFGGEIFFYGVSLDERYNFLPEFLLVSTASNNLVDGVYIPDNAGHFPNSINI